MDDCPPFTPHAKQRWQERCQGLDPDREWYKVRRAGKKTKRRIKDSCPAHRKLMEGYHGFWYGVSTNRVVLVVYCGHEKIVTVFRLPTQGI
jgi:hypothetical protein